MPVNPLLTAHDAADRRWLHTAWALWGIFLIVIAVKTVRDYEIHSVYPCFETGSRRWWQGEEVYDARSSGQDFRYGPSFCVAMGPIALWPSRVGATLWALVNVGFCFAAIAALGRRLLPRLDGSREQAVYLTLVLPAALHGVWAGQTNLMVFGFVALAAIAILDERWWLAAVLLALPAHIKVWPLAAGLLLAACWPRRLLWRLPVALLAVGAVPLLVKPIGYAAQQYHAWYELLVGPAQNRHTYRDAWTIWELISAPVPFRPYTCLQLGMAAVALGYCLWQVKLRRSAGQILLTVLVAWTVWQMVFGPGTERNTFDVRAPLMAWGVVASLKDRYWRSLMIAAFVMVVMAASGRLEEDCTAWCSWFPAIHPIGVMLFAVWFVLWNRGERADAFPCMKPCRLSDF